MSHSFHPYVPYKCEPSALDYYKKELIWEKKMSSTTSIFLEGKKFPLFQWLTFLGKELREFPLWNKSEEEKLIFTLLIAYVGVSFIPMITIFRKGIRGISSVKQIWGEIAHLYLINSFCSRMGFPLFQWLLWGIAHLYLINSFCRRMGFPLF